jgi:hypothetical protein
MTTRKFVGDIFSAIGNLGSLLWLLVVFGFISEPWIKGSELLANYSAIAALAIFVASTYWICYRFIIWRKSKSEPKTITAVSPESQATRGLDLCREEDHPKVEALLSEARSKSTVWVMGIDCAYWLDNCAEKVKKYVIDHDLSFIFLLSEKNPATLDPTSKAGLISIKSKDTIDRSIEQFQTMKSELKEKGSKIQLGIYDLPLVHSMVVVNPDTDAERIQVTHYLYKTPWVDRPCLTLRRQFLTSGQQVVFDGYHGSIKYALDSAKDEEGKSLETEPKRTYVKLGFQTQIKRDLLEIESQLNFEKPKPIHFKSWDETETEMRKQLIDNETAYGIVENIAKVLNEWNKDLDRASLLMVRPGSQICFYIQSCRKYYQKLREIGFLS